MEKGIDYYSGEVINNSTMRPVDEQMAEQFASFGQYNYGVNNINPSPYNTQYGLGGTNGFQYYNPMGNANPAFNYMNQMGMQPYQQQYQQQIPQGDITYDIPGLSFGNDYLPPAGYEDIIEQLQFQYWQEILNAEAKQEVQSLQQGVQYDIYGRPISNYNYYGYPYQYNPYQYNSYIEKYRDKLKDIEEEARERRIKLNINLSRLVQGILGHDEYDDEAIQELYRGKTVTVPGITYTDVYEQQRWTDITPFNNADYYQQKDAEISAKIRKYIKPDAGLVETFEGMNVAFGMFELEEEDHRRKSMVKDYYNSNSYKYLVKKAAMEKYANENGILLPTNNSLSDDYLTNRFAQLKQQALNSMPTLSAVSRLADDGTLHINFVEDVAMNVNESQYNEKRDKFSSYLASIPGVFLDKEVQ